MRMILLALALFCTPAYAGLSGPVSGGGGSSETVVKSFLPLPGALSDNDGLAGVEATFIKNGSEVTMILGQFTIDSWVASNDKILLSAGSWIPSGMEPQLFTEKIGSIVSYNDGATSQLGLIAVETSGSLSFGKSADGEVPVQGSYYETNSATVMHWTTQDMPVRP